MDWSLTARTAVPHVRDRVADRELETWALVDATASMDFGTGRVEKRDLAVAAVAAVGFLTDRTGNRIGAQIVGGSGARLVPPRTGRPRAARAAAGAAGGAARPAGRPGRPVPRGGRGPAAPYRRERRAASRSSCRTSSNPPRSGSVRCGCWPCATRSSRSRSSNRSRADAARRRGAHGRRSRVGAAAGRADGEPPAAGAVRGRRGDQRAADRGRAAAGGRGAPAAAHRRDWVRDIARHVMTQRRLAAVVPGPAAGGAG
nr:DUF58 domain-containing protein [Actinomadura sp. CNU-125]